MNIVYKPTKRRITMPDKVQLIKQEIERLKHNTPNAYDLSRFMLLEEIESFINSIPEEPKCIYNRTLDERKKFCKYCSAACSVRIEEEPASEDLEEEIQRAYYDKSLYDADNLDRQDFNNIAHHFAEWQKQQMMKDAVNGEVMYSFGTALEKQYKVTSERIKMDGLKLGDKVNIIIIKPEQQ